MITYEIDPQIKVRKIDDLIVLPKTILVNDFSEMAARMFRNEFAEALSTGQTVVPVVIDSYGGQVYSLMSMMDTIRSSPVPVATFVTGKAMSCAAVLFSCGTEGLRIVSPLATVLVHDVSGGAIGKVEDIKTDVGEVDRLNQIIYRLLARNCGHAEEYFLNIIHDRGHTDLYLSPEDCVRHRLASRIGHASFKVEVKTNVTFQ